MKRTKLAVFTLLVFTLIFILLPQPANAARRHKAGDWLNNEEFFRLYGIEEFIGWEMAGGSVGEAIGDSETELYPVKIKATLVDVEIGSISVLEQRISLPDSFQQVCSLRGEQVLLSSQPITLRLNGSERSVSTDYGSFSYNYQLTLRDLTYSYSKGFSSLSSPFRVTYTAEGEAEVSGSHRTSTDDETFTAEQYRHLLSEAAFTDRMQCAIDETGNMTLTAVFDMDNALDSETYDCNVWVKFQVDEVQLGKLSDGDGWIGLGSGGKGSTGEDDPAGPLSTLSISILAILLSILFGNTGGFIPTAPTGTGGAPTPVPAGLSRWLRFDGDGDIETTDPVNGQRRTFVHNGDGTYTDPVSGATYTPEELSEQMEHRADNAGTIRQDEAQFRQNVSEDSQRNQERSDESRQLEEDLQRERQERTRKEKIERIASDLGMSGASEDEVRQELQRRFDRDEDFRQKMNDYAQRRDDAVDILEATVDAADYGMAIGEAVVPGGSAVSATYKGIKNIGSTVAEKGLNTGAVIEGAIKGGTEAATTVMKPGIGKAATAFGGAVAGEIVEAVNDGGDLTDALIEGAAKGTLNAASGAVGDAYGDMVGGDNLLNTMAETAGKLGEAGFEKNVTGTVDDIVHGKDEQ